MMYVPGYELVGFGSLSPPARLRVVGKILNALTIANMADIRTMRALGMPRLPVDAVVHTVLEGDAFQDTARIAQLGGGTCPSVVAARIAELRDAGENAKWSIRLDAPGATPAILVVRGDGTIEDPCRALWNMGAIVFSMSGMWEPKLELQSFETTPADDKMGVICKMLDVLHEANESWLAEGGAAPALYDSGVYYKEEKLGEDRWQDIPRSLQLGFGDCEDIASWRVSELRHAGEKSARHAVEHRKSPTLVLYHIKVIRPAVGLIEDPSCKLGMPGNCRNVMNIEDVHATRPDVLQQTMTGGGQIPLSWQLTPWQRGLPPHGLERPIGAMREPADVIAEQMVGQAPVGHITPAQVVAEAHRQISWMKEITLFMAAVGPLLVAA